LLEGGLRAVGKMREMNASNPPFAPPTLDGDQGWYWRYQPHPLLLKHIKISHPRSKL